MFLSHDLVLKDDGKKDSLVCGALHMHLHSPEAQVGRGSLGWRS